MLKLSKSCWDFMSGPDLTLILLSKRPLGVPATNFSLSCFLQDYAAVFFLFVTARV
jgi:hypothetical protein